MTMEKNVHNVNESMVLNLPSGLLWAKCDVDTGIKKTFETLYERYSEMKRLVRANGLELIKTALVQNKGEISFREIYDENECGEILSVIYDGGNHPEYNANPFSTVNRLYLKNDNIVIDCEDCDEYYIDSVGVEDISSIANYLVENNYIH